jgi:hypothetical protein
MAIHVRNLFARCLGAPSCINLNGLLSNIRSFQLVQEIQGPSDDLLELFGLCRLIPFLQPRRLHVGADGDQGFASATRWHTGIQ